MSKILSIDVGIVNMGVCILHYDSQRSCPFVIDRWENIDLSCSTKKITAVEASSLMVDRFLSKPHLYEVDHVIVESQSCSTDKMKYLASAIQAHFETVRSVRNLTFDVQFSSGGVKTKVYDGPQIWPDIKLKTKYQRNKKTAICHTLALLESDKEYNESRILWFKTHKKKDDLSDAFLQGAYFLNKLNNKQPKKIKQPKKNGSIKRRKEEPIVKIDSDDEDERR